MANPFFQQVRFRGSAAIVALNDLDDINIRDDDGENLLHAAIAYGNDSVASEVIKRGIDVNAQDSEGSTPLHYAAEHQRLAVAQQILENGGKLSISDRHGNTPMWTAVFNVKGKKYEMVELFILWGGLSVVAHKNNYGKSALDFATKVNDERLLGLLMRK